MLIVSRHRDYYDTIKAYGIDKSVVYRREKRVMKLKDARRAKLELPHGRGMGCWGGGGGNAELRLIGFCGDIYPMVEIEGKGGLRFYCYSAEGAISQLIDQGFDLPARNWRRDGAPDLYTQQGVTQAFERRHYEKFLDFFHDYKAPIFVVGAHMKDAQEAGWPQTTPIIIFNDQLKRWGFQAVKDPPTAFQAIYQYISGVIGTNANPMVEIDDKHKAIAHGHDGAYSFRTAPGRGKGNRLR